MNGQIDAPLKSISDVECNDGEQETVSANSLQYQCVQPIVVLGAFEKL
jgi:hypothetical protein